MMDSGEIILWAAVLGLLIGIIWSLRYMVKLDRHMIDLDEKLTNLHKGEKKKKK